MFFKSVTLDQALTALRGNDKFMFRCEGEHKKGLKKGLFGEGSSIWRKRERLSRERSVSS